MRTLKAQGTPGILDSLLAVVMFTIAVIVFIILALLWTQFKPVIDNNNYNASIPLNSIQVAQIDAIGQSYFISGGQGTLLFFFFVMVAAMLISAYGEAAGLISLPIAIFFLIMIIITSMILSDAAHAILASAQFTPLVASHYASVLYIEDNLPLIAAALTIGYIVFAIVRRAQPGSAQGNYAGRFSGG